MGRWIVQWYSPHAPIGCCSVETTRFDHFVSTKSSLIDILSLSSYRQGGLLVNFHPSILSCLLPQLTSPRLAVRKVPSHLLSLKSLVAILCFQELFWAWINCYFIFRGPLWLWVTWWCLAVTWSSLTWLSTFWPSWGEMKTCQLPGHISSARQPSADRLDTGLVRRREWHIVQNVAESSCLTFRQRLTFNRPWPLICLSVQESIWRRSSLWSWSFVTWTMMSSESTASRPLSLSSGGKTDREQATKVMWPLFWLLLILLFNLFCLQMPKRSLSPCSHCHLHLLALPDLWPKLQLWWWRWGWQRHGCWAERWRLPRYWIRIQTVMLVRLLEGIY